MFREYYDFWEMILGADPKHDSLIVLNDLGSIHYGIIVLQQSDITIA